MTHPNHYNARPEAEPGPRKESTDEIELRPDAEQRFRAAVHAAAKSGPKHRTPKAQ